MKYLLILSVLIVSCQHEKKKPMEGALLTEPEVREFIAAYDKAWEERDTTAMKEMMGEGYIYFTSTGATTTSPTTPSTSRRTTSGTWTR